MPTSWQLAIKYKRGTEKGKVPCSVYFTRYDFGRNDVQVTLSVSFHDASGQIIGSPKIVSRDKMLPGDAICCSEFELEEDETISVNQESNFQVFIKIQFCHSSLYPAPKAIGNSDKNSMLSMTM
ncbi:hypothetical protein AVEN_89545-1 [Araneus ventricosus]|uniref:Uncharacterized protein n=1 Tax=Araneus ventricosus TaxID=182803 RepID=A0A4Y2QX34_ARAVE|nr:hypothetical protein AVEN_89545-1 [Araneus ventricosus]